MLCIKSQLRNKIDVILSKLKIIFHNINLGKCENIIVHHILILTINEPWKQKVDTIFDCTPKT